MIGLSHLSDALVHSHVATALLGIKVDDLLVNYHNIVLLPVVFGAYRFVWLHDRF